MNKKKLKKEFEEAIDLPEIWYSPQSDKFWMVDARDRYVQYPKGAVSTRLLHELEISKEDTSCLFAGIYKDKVVDFVTAIGGLPKGLLEIDGKKVLIPWEQRRIEPAEGDWSVIKQYLVGMLGEEQLEYYLGWLKTWVGSYYAYKPVPGQVLILVGETASGKTLLKSLHNHIFDGGGQPLKYMTGGTGFNGELCEVCSLYIDDKLNDLGVAGKKKLKAECKELAVAGEWRFEFKNKTAFTASPIQRLLICCNYTEDSVSVIPDIDGSTRNKISILDCKRNKMPMPTRTQEEKRMFWKKLEEETPAFLHHILHVHAIGDDFADLEEERMGVRGYHNEKAMKYVETYSNEGKRLFAMIEALRKKDDAEDHWEGSAGALQRILKDNNIEDRATPTSIGRFLNQRINCGSKLVEKVGQRQYSIDLRDYEDGVDPEPAEVEEEEKVEPKSPEEKQDEFFDEDPIGDYYGHH